MPGYSLVLPPPWRRINLQERRHQQVGRALDRAIRRAPREIPPDQLAPARRRLERELNQQLDAAGTRGGVDFYYPDGEIHGVSLNASFVVCSVIPPASANAGLVTPTLAELIRHGAKPVTIADTVWVRSEQVKEGDGQDVPTGLRSRQVDYLAAVPDDERRWVLVSCSVIGDGDPDSAPTALVVELFDAIVTTWRWHADGTGTNLETTADSTPASAPIPAAPLGAPAPGMLDS
jgi:hypothetical protein